MARLIVTSRARADIRQIIDYLEAHAGRSVALRFALEFDAAFDQIAELPMIGSPRAEFGPYTRLWIVNPYLVYYDFDAAGDIAVMLRVLHGHRLITMDMLRRS